MTIADTKPYRELKRKLEKLTVSSDVRKSLLSTILELDNRTVQGIDNVMSDINTRDYDAVVGEGRLYSTVTSALEAGKRRILVLNGVYEEPARLRITDNNTKITGQDKNNTVLRFPATDDGVQIYANGCVIDSLTIDCQTHSAYSALVIGDGSEEPNLGIGNHNKILNCKLLGSPHTFCIFVAGASTNTGEETLAYFYDNLLQDGNVIEGCELYSQWDGDAFSFSLQKNGSFVRNKCYGGRIAFYMTRNSFLVENNVTDSANQGIFVGAPSYNNIIKSNTVDNPASSGFKFQNQLEHPVTGSNFKDNTIVANVVRGALISYEINHTERCTFSNNISTDSIIHGFYIQESENNSFSSNIIANPNSGGTANRGSGFYLVAGSKNNIIDSNVISDSRDIPLMHTGVANREDTTCEGNTISRNKIIGKNLERSIWVMSNQSVIEGNTIEGGNYAGILLDGASKSLIANNVLKNNTRDSDGAFGEIWLRNGASDNIISTNMAHSTTLKRALSGVLIESGCDNNKMVYNSAFGNTGSVVSDTGTDNTVI